jgi:hypothetical protein
MIVTNCDLKDVEVVYYDCIFTLKGGDTIELPFDDLTIEEVLESCLINVHSKGAWSIVSFDDEIEIRSIDFGLLNDHENNL